MLTVGAVTLIADDAAVSSIAATSRPRHRAAEPRTLGGEPNRVRASHVSLTIRRVVSFLLPALALVAVAACGSSAKSSATTSKAANASVASTRAAAATAAVSIKNFAFSPVPLDVKVGETFTVTNHDGTDHTFTDNGGAFDTGHIAPAASKTVAIAKAGTYDYHCNIHPSMKGVIQVSG
jgi:plastocyanin